MHFLGKYRVKSLSSPFRIVVKLALLEVQPNFARDIIFNIFCYSFSSVVVPIARCRTFLHKTYTKRILEKFQRVEKLLGFSRRRVLENGSNGILWEISMKMLHFHDFDR